MTDFSCSKELVLKAKKHIDRLSRNIATNVYEEMDEESLREYASMEDPRIVYALDCGPDELEDRYWLMHEF